MNISKNKEAVVAKEKSKKEVAIEKEVKEEGKEATNAIGEKIIDPKQFDKKG